MTSPDKAAVFLSYASQDAEAARRICEALRGAGVEVWFDQSELRGGDAWDAAIRRQIKECALFVPVISVSTEARKEGYFRREWNIAVDRTLDMADGEAFLVPVVIDDTPDAGARVPEKFRNVQWTRLPGGEPSPSLVERIRRLVADSAGVPLSSLPQPPHRPVPGAFAGPGPAAAPARVPVSRKRTVLAAGAALAVIAVGALYFVQGRTPAPVPPVSGTASPAPPGFTPPPHSVAVLPFVNMSGDPKQDYFSDGLSEELLNSLVTVRDLQVAARTSSFSFKGSNAKLADIGRELNVGAVLEGSVRKDGNHVRITAQLINAVTGYHLWSQTYDRDLKNILALQTEIATAVTMAMQASLMSDAAATIELGGTTNPQAFDAYLRGKNLERLPLARENVLARIAAFTEAIRLDPKFAKAYVGAANAQNAYANNFSADKEFRTLIEQARAKSETAIALAPGLGEAHAAMAGVFERGYLDFARATAEYERAMAMSPNDVDVLLRAGSYFVAQGRVDAGLANIRRAIALDQLNGSAYGRYSTALYLTRRFRDAIEADERALQFNPNGAFQLNSRGLNRLVIGELDAARQDCETRELSWVGRLCLSILYDRLHRRADAEAQLAAMKAELGNGASYQYAEIYAQWGDIPKALDWLEAAYRFPDPGLSQMKMDMLVDPLRKEPRFQAIEKKLKFPD